MSKTVTLDIETVPDPRWEKANPEQAADPDHFPSLPYHRPVVIAWLVSDLDKKTLTMKVGSAAAGKGWEKSCLVSFGKDASAAGQLVSFNGRAFDMLVLAIRALRAGLDWSWWMDRKRRYPDYRDGSLYHVDLYDQLTDYGASRAMPLDGVLKTLGLPGKLDTHGNEVKELWAKKKFKQVESYCQQDVFQTWLLFIKCQLTFWQGKRTTWNAMRDASLAWGAEQPALKPLLISSIFAEATSRALK